MPKHRRRTTFSAPKRDMALIKLRVLGIPEPMIYAYDPELQAHINRLYSKHPVVVQRQTWGCILDLLRNHAAKTNADKHRRRNSEGQA